MRYWLMKSEPDVYGIDQLKKDKTTWWEGVRNYQARNFMTNDMKVGDMVLFYHSNAEPSGVAGIAKVSALATADKTALDKKSEYYDPKSTKDKPIWMCVQVQFVEMFSRVISLDEIRKTPSLSEMLVLKKGQRLSVQPVDPKHYETLVKLAKQKI